MKSNVLRFYVAAVTMLVFFVLWAVIAAKPWASAATHPGADPRVAALERRQRRLDREARLVKQTLDRRWREYRARLRRREAEIRRLDRRHAQAVAAAARAASSYVASSAPASAAARVVTLPPSVKVVTLPPATAPSTSSGSSSP